MFTIKFYSLDGNRQIIEQADSITILRDDLGRAEITLHRKNGEDLRRDINDDGSVGVAFGYSGPPCFGSAIIEDAAGKTTEIIRLRPMPAGYPTPVAEMRAA